VLRNYENNLFRYRNPRTNGHRRHHIKAPATTGAAGDNKEAVVVSALKPEGAGDENRVIIRP
jgi:hypothetical protein